MAISNAPGSTPGQGQREGQKEKARGCAVPLLDRAGAPNVGVARDRRTPILTSGHSTPSSSRAAEPATGSAHAPARSRRRASGSRPRPSTTPDAGVTAGAGGTRAAPRGAGAPSRAGSSSTHSAIPRGSCSAAAARPPARSSDPSRTGGAPCPPARRQHSCPHRELHHRTGSRDVVDPQSRRRSAIPLAVGRRRRA